MIDRRVEPRLMCADMVAVQWKDAAGVETHCTALLEDISVSGACLQLDSPMPLGTIVAIEYHEGRLEGTVCYCYFRELGYWTGVQFAPQVKWSRMEFRPKHLFDLKELLRLRGRRRETAQ
jgi:hypothetical protein